MKRRRQPTAEELERARRSAEEARVKAGLPPDPPEDAEYERLQAERLSAAVRISAARVAARTEINLCHVEGCLEEPAYEERLGETRWLACRAHRTV